MDSHERRSKSVVFLPADDLERKTLRSWREHRRNVKERQRRKKIAEGDTRGNLYDLWPHDPSGCRNFRLNCLSGKYAGRKIVGKL